MHMTAEWRNKMIDKSLEIKITLLNQIEQYLNNEITRKTFGYVAEEYYTENAHFIENTEFYETYNRIVPDACLFYIDEEALKRDGKLREEFISKFSSEVKVNLQALETATVHLKSNIRKYMLTLTGISVGCSLVAWALLQLWLR